MICKADLNLRYILIACVGLALAACSAGEERADPLVAARAALDAGDVGEAERLLEKTGGLHPSDTRGAALLAQVALESGDLEKARAWLASGEFVEPERQRGLRMMGRLALAEGDLPRAARAFDAAYRFDPEDPGLWVDIARLRFRGGEHLQAIEAARTALSLAPNDGSALHLQAQLARDAWRTEEALEWFEKALAIQPRSRAIRADYAATLADLGRAREALEVLRADGVGRTVDPQTLYVSAVIAARGQDWVLASTLLDRSGLAQRGVPAALFLAALGDCAAENFVSASDRLATLLARQPDNRRVQDLLAFTLLRSGGELELVARFGTLARRPGAARYLRHSVARAYENLGNREGAAEVLDMAAREVAYPGLIGNQSGIRPIDSVRAALARGDGAAALAAARSFADAHPGSGDALALLGDAQLTNGQRSGAERNYAKAASIRSAWPLALRRLSAIQGRDQSHRVLASALVAQPGNGSAAVHLADLEASAGQWRKAARLLDHALLHGQDRMPLTLAARSVAAHKLGDRAGALEFALAAHEIEPMNPIATEALLRVAPQGQAALRGDLLRKLASLSARQGSTNRGTDGTSGR